MRWDGLTFYKTKGQRRRDACEDSRHSKVRLLHELFISLFCRRFADEHRQTAVSRRRKIARAVYINLFTQSVLCRHDFYYFFLCSLCNKKYLNSSKLTLNGPVCLGQHFRFATAPFASNSSSFFGSSLTHL